jgi:hypothetical protein
VSAYEVCDHSLHGLSDINFDITVMDIYSLRFAFLFFRSGFQFVKIEL